MAQDPSPLTPRARFEERRDRATRTDLRQETSLGDLAGIRNRKISGHRSAGPELAEWGKSLISVLERANRWQMVGHALELKDQGGTSLAVFGAVYMR